MLSEEDRRLVEDVFGTGIFRTDRVTIQRTYGAMVPDWTLDLDCSKAFEHLFVTHKLDATERASLTSAENSKSLIDKLKALGTPTDKHKALLATMEKFKSVTEESLRLLASRLPRFMYFSSYDRMDGAVQVEQLNSLVGDGQIESEIHRGKKLFREFFDYAGIPLSDVLSETRYELFDAKLQSASNRITEQVLEYWTQNPDLEVRVKIEASKSGDEAPFNTGTIARARIHNQLHKVDTPFSERSAGFIWFFSFLVKFALVRRDASPVVLLLDEPGLTLHGTAQADLLRFFSEKLAPHHQIIYSTHSPFMIAPDRLLSCRIVEDRVEMKGTRRVPIGTKVRADVLTVDRDTLFPLQGALGYEITQSLFVGKNTLLVEGPGDVLYIKALSSALEKAGKGGLDKRWTICPSGGLGNIRSFVALFAGNKINVAVLTDLADGQRKELQRVRELEVFRGGDRVLTVPDFVGKSEADIEDIFEADTYAELLNSCYSLTGSKRISVSGLETATKTTSRLVKKAEALFRQPEYASASIEFDHFRPAEWLIQNPAFLNNGEESTKKTLKKAEQLFAAINRLV